MNILLEAIATFITEHYILTFLILISIFQVRIDIGKKKKEEPKESEKVKEEPKNDKKKPL